eukprot:TRINITY_DN33734_c0_g1_i1.p1 TRINITY_DN33734_c0_g1~~TRINITY_DN33734_c0_g1_i1.p1  ORF type:complete len:502 (+),score=163.75 TRINITY_DN33734_c0_g1_i1:168-1673(+)
MGETSELDWISDCFVAIFKAPTWVAPIAKFVDENCSIFEDLEENKLEYTPVHNAFKLLTDELLTAHLMELNVTEEQFTRFCELGMNANQELPRSIIEQLLSVDDFLVFKAMMVKRSAELHAEALLKRPADTIVAVEGDMAAAPDEASPDAREDDELDGLDATEEERLDAQRRCVEAELQLAIALSLQLEQRLRLIEALEERLRLIEKLSEVMEQNEELQRTHGADLEAEVAAATAEAAMHMAALGVAPPPVPPPTAVEAQPEEKAVPASLRLQPLQARGDTGGLPDGSPQSPHRGGPLPPLAAPPSGPLGGQPPLKPSQPQLSQEERWLLEQKRTEALAATRAREAAMQGAVAARQREMAPPPAPAPVPEAVPEAATGPVPPAPPPVPAGPSEEERRARAEHLKRQRELLVKKKNREREDQLRTHEQLHGTSTASRVAERAVKTPGISAGQMLAQELSGKAPVPPPEAVEAEKLAEKEAVAAEMRRTITRQLKQSLLGAGN